MLSLLNFVHDIVLLIISIKYFCNFLCFHLSALLFSNFWLMRLTFLFFFYFFTFINFQSFRSTLDVVTMLSRVFVNIEMWSNDWLISNLALQSSILLISLLNIKIKSIVLCEVLASQMIVYCKSVNFMSVSSITSINLFVITCCVNFESSFHKKWCRLKSLSTMCFVSTSFIHFSITDIVLTLFVKK